jgi:hypothetical protein
VAENMPLNAIGHRYWEATDFTFPSKERCFRPTFCPFASGAIIAQDRNQVERDAWRKGSVR